ncbi:MAG: polyphosphate polymerase domain-containing protein [Erysipelotrichaceae bacterium]
MIMTLTTPTMTVTQTMMTAITAKSKQSLKLRHELKHNINKQDDLILISRLRKLFDHDPNAGSHGSYRVSSLYFDTPYDKALRQKIDGVNQREKFRLRYYGENTSFIRLEKKFKINGMCGKHSVRVTADQVKQILNGDIDFLLNSEHPLLIELYSKMKGQLLEPKTVVTYDREAFIYKPGNVRVTIDRNLRSGLDSINFLNPKLFHAPVHDGVAVLEVKYDEFLPEVVFMAVQLPNRQATSYSTYAVCRKYD